jgi:hypothetical protein
MPPSDTDPSSEASSPEMTDSLSEVVSLLLLLPPESARLLPLDEDSSTEDEDGR